MEEEARDLDPGVAREGIPQVAILPPRIGLDDQDLELLLTDRDRGGELVVVGEQLVGVSGDVEREEKSPVPLGFQTIASLVRPIGATRTSLVTSSPSDVFKLTVVTCSRGSELSMVNGTRTALPPTPNVGRIEVDQLDVGQPGGTADRDREDRNSQGPQPRRGLNGGLPLGPVAVRGQDDPAEVLERLGSLSERPVEVGAVPAALGENDCTTTFIRPRSLSHDAASASGAIASCRVMGAAVGTGRLAWITSRVSMLGDASQSTATAGFSSGRYSSTHSGWLSRTAPRQMIVNRALRAVLASRR